MTLGNRYKSGITNEKWDAIIIGSGIGGLTSARLLADAGKKVLVLKNISSLEDTLTPLNAITMNGM